MLVLLALESVVGSVSQPASARTRVAAQTPDSSPLVSRILRQASLLRGVNVQSGAVATTAANCKQWHSAPASQKLWRNASSVRRQGAAFLAHVRSGHISRLAWLAVARVVVAPLCVEVVRYRATSSWYSRRDALWGWGDARDAVLWCASLALRAPTAYVRFLTREMTKADMFTHRQLLRSVIALATTSSISEESGLIGVTFYVSGKISVGGNSRSRHMVYFGGLRAPSRLFVEARTARGVVGTVTGCLGITLSFFF